MSQFFRHEKFSLLLVISTVACFVTSCNKLGVLDHYAKLINKDPDSIYRQHEKIVFNLSWEIEPKMNRYLAARFTLPSGHSAEDIIDMYAGVNNTGAAKVPKYNVDSTQELYYKADSDVITILKKYFGVPPRREDFDDFKTFAAATAIFQVENGCFSRVTVVFW